MICAVEAHPLIPFIYRDVHLLNFRVKPTIRSGRFHPENGETESSPQGLCIGFSEMSCQAKLE